MTALVPQVLHDLTDDDIHVKPLVSAASSLALTGIELRGFERVEALPVREWKGRRRKRKSTLVSDAP